MAIVAVDWSREANDWLAAEARGHDLEADAAFGLLCRSMPREAVASDLEGRIWRATRRVRLSRRILRALRSSASITLLVGGSAAAVYFGTGVLLSIGGRVLIGAVTWLMRGFVWTTVAFAEGLDTWSVLARAGSAISEAIVTPRATTVLVAIELVGALAFYALGRLLARENKEIPQ